MDGRDRGDHHGDQNRGRQRREEPEGKQRPTGQLGKAGRERHHLPRTKPKGLEEGAGSIQTAPAEEAEQLLSTVPDEQCDPVLAFAHGAAPDSVGGCAVGRCRGCVV